MDIIIKNRIPEKEITGSALQAMRLMQDCLEVLLRHYPDHPWRVGLTTDYSMINVHLDDLHANYGMTMYTKDIQNDPSRIGLVRYAGELLERSFQKRGKKVEEPTKFDIGGAENKRLADKNTTFKKVLV